MPGAPTIDLFGAFTGLCRHCSGVLVPLNTKTMDQYATWAAFSGSFCPDPVAAVQYDAPEIDPGYQGNFRIWGTIGTALLPGQTGTPAPEIEIDDAAPGGAFSGAFTAVSGTLNVSAGAIRARVAAAPAKGAVYALTGFQPAVQTTQKTVQSGTVAIAASGSLAIVFPKAYHAVPDVVASPVGNASPQFASALDITETGFTLQLLDSTGQPTAGSASWTATGP